MVRSPFLTAKEGVGVVGGNSLGKEGRVVVKKWFLRPPKEISSLRHCRVATEEDEVKLGGGGCLFDSFSAPEERMNKYFLKT